jgi:uncharacterized membrane protein YesL
MKGLFCFDNPMMAFLSKMSDLVLLNLLTLIFSIPIFTIGASVTAAHYAALKILRGESYVVRNFLKSFRENFRQSTVMWLMILLHSVIALASLVVALRGDLCVVMRVVLIAGIIISGFLAVWIFPLQSKFVNSIGGTIKNAFIMAYRYIFRTIYMLIVCCIPIVLAFILSVRLYIILILFGYSVPIFICAIAYNKLFEKMEEMIKE